jgi:hypothetical protein
MQAAVARAQLNCGPIDIVVANAGLSIPGSVVSDLSVLPPPSFAASDLGDVAMWWSRALQSSKSKSK